MPNASPSTTAASGPLVRGVVGTFQAALAAALVLVPTVFANLHRFGPLDLLFVVCLLHAFWVVSGLLGMALWHLRSWANLLAWAVLGLVFLQVVPLPLADRVDDADPPLNASAGILVEPARRTGDSIGESLSAVRLSRRPAATVGVLVVGASAAGLCWLVGSAAVGRKRVRRATWAVVLGLAMLAVWPALSAVGPPVRGEGLARLIGPVMILGGDSLVPALLAALPLCLLVVLRPLGWMPRRHPTRRQSRWGWLDRPAAVWAGIGLALTGVVAATLGMSNVPRGALVVCVLVSIGFVLGGYLAVGPGRYRERRPVRVALALALWVMLALGLGSAVGHARQPAARADERLSLLVGSLSNDRVLCGLGAGAVSSRAVFGKAGWPTAVGDDVDTDGFLVLRAEVGWAGLVLVLAGVVAAGVRLVFSWRRDRGPWPRTAMMVGFGALAANLLYFRVDATALLAPNLLALACVMGVVLAWAGHGCEWRPGRARELGESRWPLVVAAVGLLAALGLAENEMMPGAGGPELSDKLVHFGAFGVVSLLLCYALGPKPTTHYLKTRILLAVLGTAAMGVFMEIGQLVLTAGRMFEAGDIVANVLGAGLMGVLWWVVRTGQTQGGVVGSAPA